MSTAFLYLLNDRCECVCAFTCILICVQGAKLPMSIIIVGVGQAEFDGKYLAHHLHDVILQKHSKTFYTIYINKVSSTSANN